MTREEQISIASCAYGNRGSSIDFEAGARWSDKNPKSPWISVKESFPYNREELVDTKMGVTDMVLVITEDHTVKVDDMQLSGNHWEWVDTDPDFDGHVTHWMPIPKLEE
ncbi:MAG: DUF551 domain-containing protein [Alloprevotella sp.]